MAHDDDLDVLVTMLTFTNLAAITGLRLVRRGRVSVVISERNMPTLLLRIQGVGGWVKRWLARMLYRRADAVIAISHPVAGDLIGGYGVRTDRLFVVPNPVVATVSRALADHEPPEAVHLLFVGRLVEQKRPEAFVDVLIELSRRGAVARGTVVGDGPDRHRVERYARERGVAMDLVGWREPWWDSLEDVSCLVLPSSIEGFGNVLVEAAAAGIPVVACTPAMGVADAVVPGLTGDLAITCAPADIADAVLRTLARSGEDPLRQWLGRFSVDSSVATLESVLERVRRNAKDVRQSK